MSEQVTRLHEQGDYINKDNIVMMSLSIIKDYSR